MNRKLFVIFAVKKYNCFYNRQKILTLRRNAATMTEEERLFLIELKANTKRFFGKYNELENEKIQLENTVKELSRQIGELNREKSELNQKIEQLKIASQILSGEEDKSEAKQKINRLIREIDKCIALLNR